MNAITPNVNPSINGGQSVELNDRLTMALQFAEWGFRVFFIPAGQKHDSGANALSYKNGVVDPDMIRAFFAANPGCNFAVTAAGLSAVIFDVDAGFMEEFAKLEAEHGSIPGPRVKTPSGLHIYALTPYPVQSTSKGFGDVSMEIRGENGHVVGTGSYFEGDAKKPAGDYVLTNPTEVPQPCPEWWLSRLQRAGDVLLARLRKKEPSGDLDTEFRIRECTDFLKTRDGAIEGHRGNEWTYKTACKLMEKGVSDLKCLELMEEDWNEKCDPEWSTLELATIVEHAYRYAQNQPGSKASLVEHIDRQVREQAFEDTLDELINGKESEETRPFGGSGSTGERKQPGRDDDTFPFYFAEELDAIPAVDYIIDPILPVDSLCITFAPPGGMKTFFEVYRVIALSSGSTYAASDDGAIKGYPLQRKYRCVICAGEGARGLRKRIKAAAKRRGLSMADLDLMVLPVVPLLGKEGEIDKLKLTIEMACKLKGWDGVDYVVIDTLMRASAGLNLSDPAQSQLAIAACDRIRTELRCTVRLIHHTGKNEERGHMGAENSKAAADVMEQITIVKSGKNLRTIKVDYAPPHGKVKEDESPAPMYFLASWQPVGEHSLSNRFQP